MKEIRLINEETGHNMQHWYVEKLGGAVRAAARLSKHIRKFGNMTHMISDTDKLDPYALNGCSNRIREDFEWLSHYLLTAYNYSSGYDKARLDMSIQAELEMLEHNNLDPFAVDEELAKMEEEHIREMQHNEEIAKKYGLYIEEDEEKPTATASTTADPKHPLASHDAIKEAEEIDKLTAAKDAYHKTVKTLFDILPDDPDELKDLIASCEVKLESMGENPND